MEPTSRRREGLKSLSRWQRERRQRALECVRERRQQSREAQLEARRLASPGAREAAPSAAAVVQREDEDIPDAEVADHILSKISSSSLPRQGSKRYRDSKRHHASRLLQLEWLIDVPEDLHTSWFVVARPEGPRCLVVASNGSTVTRKKNGAFHKKFESGLPNGSAETQTSTRSGGAETVLDAVFHEPTKTFYVTDCVQWDGYSLADCDFEFRMFWLSQRLPSAAEGGSNVDVGQDFAVVAAIAQPADRDAIARAYAASGSAGYATDGLVFTHRDCPYSARDGRPTPLCLQWKDSRCSRYPIDTDDSGVVLERQAVVLEVQRDGRSVGTGDDPPVVLGSIPQDFAERQNGLLRPGMLLRFELGAAGFTFGPEGRPVGASLELKGVSGARVRGDLLSRILFQHLSRTRQVNYDDLVREARMEVE